MNSPAFALAIYRVDLDEIFFICGQDNVRSVYEAQSSWNGKHVPFDSLSEDKIVRIAVDFDKGIPGDWKVPKDDANWLTERLHRMVETVMRDKAQAEQAVQGLWNTFPEDEQPDES